MACAILAMVLTEPKLLPRAISEWLILLKTQYALTSVAYLPLKADAWCVGWHFRPCSCTMAMLLLASHRSNCGGLNPRDMVTSGLIWSLGTCLCLWVYCSQDLHCAATWGARNIQTADGHVWIHGHSSTRVCDHAHCQCYYIGPCETCVEVWMPCWADPVPHWSR